MIADKKVHHVPNKEKEIQYSIFFFLPETYQYLSQKQQFGDIRIAYREKENEINENSNKMPTISLVFCSGLPHEPIGVYCEHHVRAAACFTPCMQGTTGRYIRSYFMFYSLLNCVSLYLSFFLSLFSLSLSLSLFMMSLKAYK